MKWRAAALTAIRPCRRAAWPRMTRLPSSYDGEKPAYAWNVATLTLVDSRSRNSDRNGTNGSWKWSRSNCSSVEHPLDLADVARRERQRPDRPVGRHGEADAEPDDVALGRALRAVAGGDDPDVVTAPGAGSRTGSGRAGRHRPPPGRCTDRRGRSSCRTASVWSPWAGCARSGAAPGAGRRSAAGAAARRDSRGPAPCRPCGHAPGSHRGHRARACAAGRGRSRAGRASRGTSRGGASPRRRWPRAGRPPIARGTSSSRSRSPRARGRRCCRSGRARTARRTGRRSRAADGRARSD